METAGIINLLKPAGMTSHDAVAFLRRLTGIKRIGHTGTLDPMAVGVLPICIGTATRIMDYLDLDEKTYRCEMQLGLVTDTQDIWGTVLEDRRNDIESVTKQDILDAFCPLVGEIHQTPPQYSAVRIKGKHLYEYARQGQEVEVEKRPVIIYQLELLDFQRETGRVLFDVTCSKGTYVRSICHEVGQKIGCGAAMSFLLRTATGAFSIHEAVTLESLATDWQTALLPTDFPLTHLGRLELPSNRIKWFSSGGELREDEVVVTRTNTVEAKTNHIRVRGGLDQAYAIYGDQRFLGVVQYRPQEHRYLADKVLMQ